MFRDIEREADALARGFFRLESRAREAVRLGQELIVVSELGQLEEILAGRVARTGRSGDRERSRLIKTEHGDWRGGA